jgi:hypothetical protein
LGLLVVGALTLAFDRQIAEALVRVSLAILELKKQSDYCVKYPPGLGTSFPKPFRRLPDLRAMVGRSGCLDGYRIWPRLARALSGLLRQTGSKTAIDPSVHGAQLC